MSISQNTKGRTNPSPDYDGCQSTDPKRKNYGECGHSGIHDSVMLKECSPHGSHRGSRDICFNDRTMGRSCTAQEGPKHTSESVEIENLITFPPNQRYANTLETENMLKSEHVLPSSGDRGQCTGVTRRQEIQSSLEYDYDSHHLREGQCRSVCLTTSNRTQNFSHSHTFCNTYQPSLNVAHMAILSSFDKLVTALAADPLSIAASLLAKGFISSEVYSEMLLHSYTSQVKAGVLAMKVKDTISIAPKRFHELIQVFSEQLWMKDIVEILQLAYQGKKKYIY